jgi:hypothetical protein
VALDHAQHASIESFTRACATNSSMRHGLSGSRRFEPCWPLETRLQQRRTVALGNLALASIFRKGATGLMAMAGLAHSAAFRSKRAQYATICIQSSKRDSCISVASPFGRTLQSAPFRRGKDLKCIYAEGLVARSPMDVRQTLLCRNGARTSPGQC